MGKHGDQRRQRMSFARALSILLTVSMVLSLVPSQGIIEAQEEVAAAMGGAGGAGITTADDAGGDGDQTPGNDSAHGDSANAGGAGMDGSDQSAAIAASTSTGDVTDTDGEGTPSVTSGEAREQQPANTHADSQDQTGTQEPITNDGGTSPAPEYQVGGDAGSQVDATNPGAAPKASSTTEATTDQTLDQHAADDNSTPLPVSANLRDFIVAARVDGAELVDDVPHVKEGETYTLNLTFNERPDATDKAKRDLQFDPNPEGKPERVLSYVLPEGFAAAIDQPSARDPFLVRYTDAEGNEQTVELSADSWWVEDGVVHVAWKALAPDDTTTVPFLDQVDNLRFELAIAGGFAKDATALDFGLKSGPVALVVTPTPEEVADDSAQGAASSLAETTSADSDSGLPPSDSANAAASQTETADTAPEAPDKKTAAADTYNAAASQTETADTAPEAPDKKTAAADTYIYENDAIRVTAKPEKAGAIPDDAELAVAPITGEPADPLLAALNEFASDDKVYDAANTLLYDIAFMKEGQQVEPTEGSVSVAIQFKDGQLAGQLKASMPSDVQVNHLTGSEGEVHVEPLVATVMLAGGITAFKTESFSPFAVSVPTTKQGLAIGIAGVKAEPVPGKGSATDPVPEETFAAPTMSTQATVTDLNEMVKDVYISVPRNSDGTYTLMPGDSYAITMSFAEDSTKQFPNDTTHMLYTMPSDFKLSATDPKLFTIIVTKPDGTQSTVGWNSYRINENNQIEVWFAAAFFPGAYDLINSTNARFSLSVDGVFDSDGGQIDFGNGVTINANVDQTSKVDASKSASVDLANGKVYYTAVVTSTGQSNDVKIQDMLGCKDQNGSPVSDVLTLDRGSFKRNSNKGENAYTEQNIPSEDVKGGGNTFSYTIGEMGNGEVVTVKYSANIDITRIPTTSDGKIQVMVGNNKVAVTSNKQSTPSEAEVNTRIDYSPKLQNDGMTLNQDGKSFKASYTFNGDALVSGGGYKLEDEVGDSLTLEGTAGASVTVYKSDGSEARGKTSYAWGQGGFAKTSAKQFTYTVPEEDRGHNYKYVVEFEVKIDETGQSLDTPTTVYNTVRYDDDHVSTGTGVTMPSNDDALKFTKRVNSIDYANKRVSWTTTINVPNDGLDDAQAEVKDYLPATLSGSGWFHDELYVDSSEQVRVSGLLDGESYNVSSEPGNEVGNSGTFTLVFMHDGQRGLKTSDSPRIVTITYQTSIDEDWLAATAENDWLQGHTNTVEINGESTAASALIAGADLTKTSELAGYRSLANGVKLPVYKYTVLLRNVTKDDNTIEDLFDTELLTPLYTAGDYSSMGTLDFEPDYFAWYTTNQDNGTRSTNPVSYIPISKKEGNESRNGIAISTDYGSMVRDSGSSTGHCPVTKITYYLTVKDEVALRKLQNRAVVNADGDEDDKTYTLTNNATWDGSSDSSDVKYRFPGITVEMLNDNGQPMTQQDLTVEDGEVYGNFKLTVNPGGVVINGGNPYAITDTTDHLGIDIASIRVSPTPGNGEVTYDMEDNELKFKSVPDGKEFVITYRARVMYDSTGNIGDTIDVNVKNDVRMLAYEDHINEWAHRKNNGTSAAGPFAIKLMKYEAGDMSQKLDGAEFALYESKAGDDGAINANHPTGYVINIEKPVKDKDGNVVTFTSGGTRKYGLDSTAVDADGSTDGIQEEPGMVTVYGLKNEDGWALEPDTYYFLRETKAPENHKLPSSDFQFMVSKDGSTNHESHIYHSNDMMSVKNYPGKDIHIKKYWGTVKQGGNPDVPADRSYQPADTEKVVVRLQQKIGDGDWSNTIRREVKQGDATVWADANEDGYPTGNVYSPLIELNKSNGWEADFKDLPLAVPTGEDFTGEDAQVEYQVLEWSINGKGANRGTVQQDGSNAAYTWTYQSQGNDVFITNVPKEGSIKLRKQVQVNGSPTTGKLADGSYSFTIAGAAAATSSIKKSVVVEVENGATKRAVVDGDTDHPLTPDAEGYIEIGGLKLGNYKVTEEEPGNGTCLVEGDTNPKAVTVDGKTGADILPAGTASFTNNIDLGSLKIRKVVVENSVDSVSSRRAKDKLAGTYNFNVYTDEVCTNLAKTIDGKDARLSITIGTDGQAVTSDEIQNLKVGDYWVREVLPEGSTAAPVTNPVKVTVERGKTGEAAATATLTNKYDTGSLKIKKNVTINGAPAVQSDSKAKTNGTYRFQIWKGGYKAEKTQRALVEIDFADGVAQSARYEWTDERGGAEGTTPVWKTEDISVADGVVTLRGLEPGTYTVHEIDDGLPTGMKLVGANDQQVIVAAGDGESIQTAEFTNDYEELGELEFKKSIITQSPIAVANTQFNFTVTMYKDAACTEVDTSIDGSYGQVTFRSGTATNIKLVGGEKKTASNLPTGRYYRITEDATAGWSLTGITVNGTKNESVTQESAASGKIGTTRSTVEFENTLDEGDLEVKKIVNSTFDQDKTREFRFKVVLDGSTLTGTYGTDDAAMKFTNGVAEFTLRDGQSKKAVKLPANTKYTVTETSEEGFVTTWTDDTESVNPSSGTIVKGITKTVTATNAREYGNLEIDKTVLPDSHQGSGDEFTFTVSLSDKSINGTFESVSPTHKSITFTSGVGQVALKHGEVASVKDLPAGITYAVTEAKAEGFALSGVTGNTGKIVSQATAKAEFTNQYDNGGLVISKNVNSATSTDDDLYFPFKVTISLPAGGTYLGLNGKVAEGDDISYANGVAYVFLKKGQQAVSNGLGTDYGYQVRELDISDASVKTDVQGHLPDGVTIDQVADLSRYSTVIQDGSNKIVNPNGGTTASGKISAATSSVRYTNTHITGPLTISKKLVTDAAADRNKEFAFEVKMLKAAGDEVDTSINGAFGGMTFSQGVATVAVRGNGSVTATGLPEGLAFEIAEKDMPANFTMKGYAIDGVGEMGATARGNIARGGRTVEFTNERATGPLTLSKELISGRAADANQDFTFTVRLSDTSITKEYDATYTPAKDPAETKVRFTQGVATVMLKGGQTVKIDGLPTELQYMVTEAETPGFRMTGVTKSEHGGMAATVTGAVEGVIVSDPDDAITYQNTRTSGELTVSKKLISDLPADAALPFDFNITFDGLTDAAKNGQFDISYSGQNAPDGTGKIQLTNGAATIRLIGGASATIVGLPSDVTYTVTEASVADFKITGVTGTGTDIKKDDVVNGKTGTIATTPASVEVTNTRETGKLTVSKKLFSQKTSDVSKEFTFTVRLGHLTGSAFEKDDISASFGGVTFTNGEGTFTLKGGQSKTIDGLPRGIRYEVTEAADTDTVLSGVANDGNEANLEATRTKADGAITQDGSKALFKNTGKRGGLQGSMAVSGPTAPDQEFAFTLRLAGVAEVNGEGFTDGGTTYSYGKYYANASDAAGTAISFSNGAATFKIKKGGSFKLENLPLGTRYTLTEISANGFATTVTNGTQVASANDAVPGNWYFETGEVGKTTGVTYVGEVVESTDGGATFAGPAFLNTHEEGSLRIHKVVNSNYETDKDASYTFRVELSDKSITAVQGDSPTAYITGSGYGKVNGNDNIIPFKNGVATFTLGHNKYASITGLPAGTTYTVTETSVEGIETTWTDTVSGEEAVRHEGKGTIKRDAIATTEAKNTRMLGELDITKTVISHTPADKETEYTFKVSFYSDKDLHAPTSVRVKYKTDDYSAELVAVNAEFRLSDGEVAHFTELPQGIYYKVEETGKYVNQTRVDIDEGMTTSTKLGPGRTDSGKIDKFTISRFINTRIEGGLVVHKNVSSHIESDKQKEFDFRVTLYKEDPTGKTADELKRLIATDVNGVFGTGENAMNFAAGVATFKLKDSEFRYAMNLPAGYYFRAMEANDADFNVTTSGSTVTQDAITYKVNNRDVTWGPSTGMQGRISASGNVTATVTNTRKAGNLRIQEGTNENAGSDAGSSDEEFSFTVELSDKTVSGTFGEPGHEMVFHNGWATFQLKMGDYKSTVEHEGEGGNRHEVGTLPAGIRYRVTERNAAGRLTSWESVTYANDTEGENDTPTTYRYSYNQTWTSNEMSEGMPLYHEDAETRTITWKDANGTEHTTTAVNPKFNSQYAGSEGAGANNSWTLGDHATEFGWHETDTAGNLLENSTVQIGGITENNGVPNTDTVTFHNVRQAATIVLYNSVTSGLASDLTKKFHFHLRLLDSVPAGEYDVAFLSPSNAGGGQATGYDEASTGKVSFDERGMATVVGVGEGFDLSHMEQAVISGLPLGTRYEVTEDAESDFDTHESNARGKAGYGESGERLLISDEVRQALPEGAGSLPDGRARSGYHNSRRNGELEVRKTVVSNLASDKAAMYRFDIQLSDTTYEAIYSKYEFDSHANEYALNKNEQVKFSGGKVYQWKSSSLGEAGIELKDGQLAHFYSSKPADGSWQLQPGEIAYVPMDEDGGSVDAAKALPCGVSYTVTETQSNGLTTAWAGTTADGGSSATGIIGADALAVADCTNTRESGSLTVSKELISDAAADKTRAFDFTVRLFSDAEHTKPLDLSGRFGAMTFSQGVAHVRIMGGDSITAVGLPDKAYYVVTEARVTNLELTGVAVNGTASKKPYTYTSSNQAGASAEVTEEGGEGQILGATPSNVVFTSERVKGDLRISKQVFSVASSDNDDEFVLTVRLTDEGINNEQDAGKYTYPGEEWKNGWKYPPKNEGDKPLEFKNGIASVRLKSGQYASAVGLPTDVRYSVNEENATGFIREQVVSVNGRVVETRPDSSTPIESADNMYRLDDTYDRIITQDNVRETGGFTIEKILNSKFTTDFENETFRFHIKLYSTYVAEGEEANVREKGVTTDETWTGEPAKTYGDAVFSEGEADIYLKGGAKATITNLPVGLYYTVEEIMTADQAERFQLSGSVGTIQSGQVSGSMQHVSFTNDRLYKGDLLIKKLVSNPVEDTYAKASEKDKDQEFTFRVTLYTDWAKEKVADIDREYATLGAKDKPLKFVNGVATVTLKHDEQASAAHLPIDMAYEVEELLPNASEGSPSEGLQGFTSLDTYYTGKTESELVENGLRIIGEGMLSEAVFTNLRWTTKAAVKKVWKEAWSYEGKERTDSSVRPKSLDVTLLRDGKEFTTVTLDEGNGWTVELTDLPEVDYEGHAYAYTWKEPELAGYTPGTTPPANLDDKNQLEAYLTTLTNTRDLGNLEIVKHVQGTELTTDEMKGITFAIEGPGGFRDERTLDQFVDDHAGGRVWTLSKIPTGEYTVTETDATRENWTVTTTYRVGEGAPAEATSATATVAKDSATIVDVTNAYREHKGSLRLTKLVTGEAAMGDLGDEERAAISFTVTGPGGFTETRTLADFDYAADRNKPTWLLPDLAMGTYMVTETIGAAADRSQWEQPWTITRTIAVDGTDAPAGKAVFENDAQTIDVTLTNAYVRDRGALQIEKRVTVGGRATKGTEADGTYRFKVSDATGTVVATPAVTVKNGASEVATVRDLLPGTYTVSEVAPDNGTFLVSADSVEVEVEANNDSSVPTASFTNDKPEFQKRVKDVNDSTGEESGWQDSADYDIGDAVPFQLTASLAPNVTDFRRYHVTFTDQMEESLTFDEKSVEVLLNGTKLDAGAYTLTRVDDQRFTLRLDWAGEGGAKIADATLNGAKVEVLFSATLNGAARLGKAGNVNAAKLAFSSNPASADDSDEGELPWDYVIAFTYGVDVSKVDPEDKPLAGAEFRLEKLVKGEAGAADSYVEIQTIAANGGEAQNVLTATGLDDGIYRLTETKAPEGYQLAEPVSFEVRADHAAAWDRLSDAAADVVFDADGTAGSGRRDILTALTGELVEGKLSIAEGEGLREIERGGSLVADAELQGLSAFVEDMPEETPLVGALQVQKRVVSSREQDKARDYGFEVTLYYNGDLKDEHKATLINGTYGDMEFKDGVASFTLRHDEIKQATDLPLDEYDELWFEAVETDDGGLRSEMSRQTPLPDGTKAVTCTNTYTTPTPTPTSTYPKTTTPTPTYPRTTESTPTYPRTTTPTPTPTSTYPKTTTPTPTYPRTTTPTPTPTSTYPKTTTPTPTYPRTTESTPTYPRTTTSTSRLTNTGDPTSLAMMGVLAGTGGLAVVAGTFQKLRDRRRKREE